MTDAQVREAEDLAKQAAACALRVGRDLGEPAVGHRISNAILDIPADTTPPGSPDADGAEGKPA